MEKVFLIKAGKSEALRGDKFWMVVFRNITNEEIAGLDWYSCIRKNLLVNLALCVTYSSSHNEGDQE